LLGCSEGRSSDDWVDFDLYGHQIVAHVAPDELGPGATNPVDATTFRCGTMFLTDRCGNALEFKAFASPDQLFAK